MNELKIKVVFYDSNGEYIVENTVSSPDNAIKFIKEKSKELLQLELLRDVDELPNQKDIDYLDLLPRFLEPLDKLSLADLEDEETAINDELKRFEQNEPEVDYLENRLVEVLKYIYLKEKDI